MRLRRGQAVEFVLEREIGVDDRPFATQQIRKPMIVLRADDHIDRRLAAQNFAAFGLRDATRDDELRRLSAIRPLALDLARLAEFGKELLRRLLADMAGVVDDEIGLGDLRRLLVALRRRQIRHALRIIDIHLAAE